MGEKFRNWGRTVENEPAKTLVPKTRKEISTAVQEATAKGLTVRASGYRHSWADVFSADGQILISMLKPSIVETIPAPEPEIEPGNELQGIEIVGESEGKALCRIGAATTNEQFRRWCVEAGRGGERKWTVPLNVIMVEITWGGSNAAICHGAGFQHETLSDLVTEVEFINAKGAVQTVKDENLLKSAAGCFGLLGIVTAITIKLDPMSYARLRPETRNVALTVPPPVGFDFSEKVEKELPVREPSAAETEEARTRFLGQCEDSYYAEWFWFPYQADGWANCWDNDGSAAEAVEYPDALETAIEEGEEALAELLEESSWFKTDATGREQAELFGDAAMAFMPSGTDVVTPLVNALHFRRGIQNFRCLDMELSIPLPIGSSGVTPDWGVCQQAWWDAIECLYAREDAPMRVALEMRVMGGSSVTMAPQYGNENGTCAIEVLTNLDTPQDQWESFMQEVAAKWSGYTDHDGNPLNVRPHWAKEWESLEFQGMPAVTYLRKIAYAGQIRKFRADLETVSKEGGYTLADLKVFSNPLLHELFEI